MEGRLTTATQPFPVTATVRAGRGNYLIDKELIANFALRNDCALLPKGADSCGSPHAMRAARCQRLGSA